MIVDLGEPKSFKVAYVAAWDWDAIGYDAHKRLGVVHVYVGDNSGYLANTHKATEDIYATGWHKATSDVPGRYISLRREGLPYDENISFRGYFDVAKFEVYQCPNLLDVAGVSASITSDTVPMYSNDWTAQNLLDNQSTRVNNARQP